MFVPHDEDLLHVELVDFFVVPGHLLLLTDADLTDRRALFKEGLESVQLGFISDRLIVIKLRLCSSFHKI